MVGITREGIVVKTYEQIVEDISQKYKQKWGASFDTTPESPDGHNIRILAKFIADYYQQLTKAYHSYNLAVVEGVGLDNLVRLGNMFRIRNRPTAVVIEVQSLTGDSDGATLPKGTVVKTVDNLELTTNDDLVIPGSVLATATREGPIPIGIGEVTSFSPDIFNGDVVVSNSIEGVTGIEEEKDSMVLSRYNRRLFLNARNLKESIYSALSDLDLEFVSIIENDTDELRDSIPANSFLVIVEGSTPQLIAERIESKKPLGIKAVGDIEVTVYDSEGIPEVIGFSRPARVDINVRVTVFRPKNASIDSIGIFANNVLNKVNSTKIASDVYWASLFQAVTPVDPNITVRDIEISRDGGVTWKRENISISNREKAVSRIDLIEVVEEPE